jgi:hypothetical protein
LNAVVSTIAESPMIPQTYGLWRETEMAKPRESGLNGPPESATAFVTLQVLLLYDN